ncbi:high mobility group box domain-containing protein [Gigaspora rosea]|uniref:High mobility group box domain-containing protein n=1 Tax=Gigaspora rosea TaxID=44941 RepID=A0A397VBT5_9GLOM|nr:high mobility group box domain-containing protein [Gigaspora rosea]
MVRNTIAGGNTPSQQQQPSSFPQTNVAAQAKPSKNAPVNTTPTPLPKTTNSLPPQDVKNQDITSNIPQTKDQKPKRPMNAFIIFSSERRPELQKNDPNMQTAQVSKILGEEWQNMDSTRKDHYNERARQLKEEFKQSNPDFVRHPTAPKHPMSGFLFYALEMRPHVAEQNPGSTVGPISKIIAGHWKNLTPEQRAPWEKKASDDKARYAREMEQYLQSQKDDE